MRAGGGAGRGRSPAVWLTRGSGFLLPRGEKPGKFNTTPRKNPNPPESINSSSSSGARGLFRAVVNQGGVFTRSFAQQPPGHRVCAEKAPFLARLGLFPVFAGWQSPKPPVSPSWRGLRSLGDAGLALGRGRDPFRRIKASGTRGSGPDLSSLGGIKAGFNEGRCKTHPGDPDPGAQFEPDSFKNQLPAPKPPPASQ